MFFRTMRISRKKYGTEENFDENMNSCHIPEGEAECGLVTTLGDVVACPPPP